MDVTNTILNVGTNAEGTLSGLSYCSIKNTGSANASIDGGAGAGNLPPGETVVFPYARKQWFNVSYDTPTIGGGLLIVYRKEVE